MTGLSHRIVEFIGHLLPLYVEEKVDGVWCARSLADGTLIVPMMGGENDEEGLVTVHWQGDASRASVVQGVLFASLAVAKYAELHAIATTNKFTKDAMGHMAHHFEIKTGESLVFELAGDSELFPLLGKAVSKLGEETVVELIKKSIGL